MDRPYFEATIEQLEQVAKDHLHSRVVLATLREELVFRQNRRARQLLREVEGLLAGEVQMPAKPAKPNHPENQLGLI